MAPSASVLTGFYCKTHLHKIGFVLTLVLKVRVFWNSEMTYHCSMGPPDRFTVQSPEMLSYVPRHFVMLKNILASLLPFAAPVSSDRRF